MRLAISILTVLFLASCAGKDGQPPEEGRKAKKDDPKPSVTLEWGDLKCQKSATCKDVVLNKTQLDLVSFFAQYFAAPQKPQASKEYAIYLCGHKSYLAWLEFFKLPPSSPEPAATDELMIRVLNLETCIYEGDLNEKLKNYLTQTEDYKNELN
jgi:hypothetical protein